jgi:hypothetical protein
VIENELNKSFYPKINPLSKKVVNQQKFDIEKIIQNKS